MNTEFLAEWSAALRSGLFKQTQGKLHRVEADGTESFCCLGVAEHLMHEKGLNERVCDARESGEIYGYQSGDSTYPEFAILTDATAEYIGITKNPRVIGAHLYSSLAEMNDDGYTFDQIADIIDAGFVVKNA